MGSRAWWVAAVAVAFVVAGIGFGFSVFPTRHWTAVSVAAAGVLAALVPAVLHRAASSAEDAPKHSAKVKLSDASRQSTERAAVFRGSGNVQAGDFPGASQPPQGGDGDPSGAVRILVAELPAQAELGCDISLIIRITTTVPDSPLAATASLSRLMVNEQGTPVTVVVLAPGGLVPGESLEQVIWVYPGQDPPPIRFPFHSRTVGLQRVRITAWAGGSFLCELVAEVSVARGTAPTATPRPRIARLGGINGAPGEVTLQISAADGRYAFQLLSDAYLGRFVHAEALIGDPNRAVEDAIKTLRAMAIGRSGYSTANARRLMREVGVGLWIEMVPEVVKEEFWRLRSDIGAFSIAASDGIPWELLYPIAPGKDEGFLIEQFPVLRRALGQGRSKRLRVADPRFVVSSAIPGNAQSEVEKIRRLVGDGALLTGLAELMTAVDAGKLGLTHFACHNTFTPGGGSVIEMDDGPFIPAMLNTAVARCSLMNDRPLVFMNACRTAGTVPEYTQMAGWGQQFMAAGAGAFVGTLWAVRSDSACAFAEAFYERIMARQALGEAALGARNHIRGSDSDPTWLAYSVYGDPAAVITP